MYVCEVIKTNHYESKRKTSSAVRTTARTKK